MSASARIAGALGGHPWLTAAYASEHGVLVVLGEQGQVQLRQQGRQFLLEALREQLTLAKIESPADWRVIDAPFLLTDPASITALLRTPRPRAPIALSEEERDGQWKLQLRLPLDLVHFDDHFRQAPVLAGVVQVNFALALAAPRLGTSPHCREMEALKFQRLLRPGDVLELSLRYEDEPGEVRGKLHFAYRLDGEHCSSGRLRVTKTP